MSPKFVRQYSSYKKRASSSWRKPRGIDSKQKKHMKDKGAHPRIGYRGPKLERGLHPSGLEEVMVYRIAELEGLDAEKQCVRIAAGVAKRSRIGIVAKAEEMKIKVLNG